MKKIVWLGMCAVCAALSAQAIQTAGDLLVDLDAADLVLAPNDKVGYWPNMGTVGGYYTNVTADQGGVFNADGGVNNVVFLPNANWSVMTNVVAVPASICGAEPWSFEVWVKNPNLSQTEIVFSWTARNNWPGGVATGTCMEFRYGGDTGNAVEHNGNNVSWNGAVPTPGLWHHVACTRDAEGREKLFVNGVLRQVVSPLIMRIRTDGVFTLGGVRNLTGTYDSIFGGSIARLRIHDGTLSDGDVVANYLEERAAFGVSDTPDSVWAGAADAALPWETAANWADGALPGSDSRVAIANGGTSVITTAVGEIGKFFPYHGTLVMSNSAVLVVPPKQSANVSMGINSNNVFNLFLKEGVLYLPDATNGNHLYVGHNGGTGVVTVGGGEQPAVLDVGRDLRIGQGNYATGRLTIEPNGTVCASNATIFVGVDGIADARVTVNGGYLGYRTRNKDMVIAHNNAYGVLEVNDGEVIPTQDLQFGRDATARCNGTLQLNGGLVQARRFYGHNLTGTNILFFNGGMIRNTDSRTDFLYNLRWAYVQPGGARIDILPNTAVTGAQPLLSDPILGDGGLVKSGNGTLTLTGAHTFTGAIHVAAGHLYLNNAASLPAGYAAPITLEAAASIGYNKTGGANELLALIPTASPGGLLLYANNASEDIDLSSYPNLGLSFASGVTYSGSYTPYNHAYRFAPAGTGNVYGQTIADGAGTATVTVEGLPDGAIELTADNSYSGGTTILGGMLSMAHPNALGLPAATPDIGIYNGAALKLNHASIPASIVSRIKPDSEGAIILGPACAGLNLDLSGLPGVRIGTDQGTLTHTGTLTPEGTIYRAGGGRLSHVSSNLGLILQNITDDGATARQLVIDLPGMVCPSNATHSGGTVVTNGGILQLRWDHGLGAVPAAYDPLNLYVDGGVLRPSQTTFTTHANRGITVGPDGMILHSWGSQTFTVNGGLHGSGAITNTDSGTVTLAGTGNTYSGMLTLNTGTINVGNGANFSWNPAARVNGIGGTFSINHNSDLTWSSNLGGELGKGGYPNFAFRKQGRGTLTADVTQLYTGTTTIDAGTLKVAAPEALPTGHNRGNVTLNNQNTNPVGTIDVNGFDVTLNGLNGAGAVADSTASATALSVGNNNQFSNFRGTVAPNLTLAKVGTGSMLLSKGALMKDLTLIGGTITNAPGAEIAGTLTAFANTALFIGAETNEVVGLLGEYFDFSNTALRWIPHVTNFVTLARITEVLAPYAPATIAISAVSNVFSFGSTGALFQNRGDYRVGRWTGMFYAATAGEYGFNTLSDDGSMVFVNGITVVSNNFNQGYTSVNPKVLTPITLAVGWHDIVVAYFNGTGGYGLTLFMTPPGGVSDELPQSLLRPAPVRAGALTGAASSSTLFHSASAALQVGDAGEAVYDGLVKATNTLNLVEKVGAGTQTLRRLDFAGLAQVKEGTLTVQGSPMYGGAVQAFNAGASVYDGATLRVEAHADDWPNAGLAGSYYNIPNFGDGTFASLPSIESYFLTRIPDHHYGTHLAGSTFLLNPNSLFPPPYNSGAYNDFQVLYQGKVVAREAGTYGFRLDSDDRTDLYVNGIQIITNAASGTPKSGVIVLQAGTHDILVPFRQGGGGYRISLQWTPPGSTQVYLPNDMLRPCVAQTGPLAATAGGALSLADAGSFLRVNETAPSTLAGAIDGPVGSEIEKAGAAALTLAGDNEAFHGNWFISAGELWAGDGLTSGTLGGSNVYISGGAALVFNRSDDIVYAGTIAGRGQIRSAGTGKVRLTGDANGFLGTVEVGAGQSVTLDRSVLSTNATVNNAGTFGLSSARAFFAGSRITGAGETRLSEGATLGLGALDFDFPNTLAVSNGVLALAVTNANDTWQLDRLTLDAGTTLDVVSSGLFGRYYDIAAWNTDVMSNAFLSVASAEDYLATQTYTFSASTWLLGEVVDFGTTGNFFPGKYSNATGTRKTNFAVSWKGRLRVTEPGLYTFSTSSDDHSMLFINNALVVDNNGNHPVVTRTGTVELGVGLHELDLFFTQGGGGYGLYVDIRLPGQSVSQRLPNSMLVAAAADTPAYVLTVDTLAVTNGPGVGTVALAGAGTLKLTDLWIDTGAELAVTGAVACAGATITVTVPQEVEYGVTYVGDFRGTDGLDVDGVTLSAVGTEGSLRYREKRLYIARAAGTLIILR